VIMRVPPGFIFHERFLWALLGPVSSESESVDYQIKSIIMRLEPISRETSAERTNYKSTQNCCRLIIDSITHGPISKTHGTKWESFPSYWISCTTRPPIPSGKESHHHFLVVARMPSGKESSSASAMQRPGRNRNHSSDTNPAP